MLAAALIVTYYAVLAKVWYYARDYLSLLRFDEPCYNETFSQHEHRVVLCE